MRVRGIAGLAFALCMGAASAQEMQTPRISPAQVDWGAVAPELAAIEKAETGNAADNTEVDASAAGAVGRINDATAARFANIAASAIPVLLPFDTPALMRDRADAGKRAQFEQDNYLAPFDSIPFFYAGPGGYDAVVLARAQDMLDLGIGFSEPIYIHIGGAALLYDLSEPTGIIEWSVAGLDEFPGLRRVFLENYVRYIFVRYGVPYAVAVECVDGASRFRKISCRDADKVAIRALKALHFVGGTPQHPLNETGARIIDRPESQSSVFTYFSPGNLVARSGFKRNGGAADRTVYARIQFPLADAPAFANSQTFTGWSDCETNGGIGPYRCHPGEPTWPRNEAANYSYPWRDNFCESRYFYVGQCPGGLGHQGQDLRPAFCKQRAPGAHCEPGEHDLVAVRDGAVLRAARQESLYLVVNAPNERIRFRYLHMSPKQLDADGIVSGRFAREGEAIGKVGNFFRREAGTFSHLHFDVQVPTKYGWVFVNPYMTLVAAYERLIHGRGQEISEEIGPDVPTGSLPVMPAPSTAAEAHSAVAAKSTEMAIESAPGRHTNSGMRHHEQMVEPAPVTASLPAVAGGRIRDVGHGDFGHEGSGTGHRIGVRALGHGFSRARPRAWHLRRDVHAGDEQR